MLKKILIYLLGNVLSRAIIFVLLPVYSTYIVPEEYGYYDIVITYLSFITSSFCLEIWTTLLRFAIEKKDKAMYFVGEYRLTEMHQNVQPDENGMLRRVFVFHLTQVSDYFEW